MRNNRSGGDEGEEQGNGRKSAGQIAYEKKQQQKRIVAESQALMDHRKAQQQTQNAIAKNKNLTAAEAEMDKVKPVTPYVAASYIDKDEEMRLKGQESQGAWAAVNAREEAKQEAEEKNTGSKPLAMPVRDDGPPIWREKIKLNWEDVKTWLNEPIADKALATKQWLTGEDVGYKGSGWWHGPRRLVAEILHMPKTSSNLGEFLLASLLHEDSITITGQLLEILKKDPAILRLEEETIKIAKDNPDYGIRPISAGRFDYPEFGGERDPAPMEVQIRDPFNTEYAETWQVAMNPLSWTLRHATVGIRYFVTERGEMQIIYTVYDIANLRKGEADRSSAYDKAVAHLGYYWHEVLGGNDAMEVNASWFTHSTP